MMCAPRVSAICSRAGSSWAGSVASSSPTGVMQPSGRGTSRRSCHGHALPVRCAARCPMLSSPCRARTTRRPGGPPLPLPRAVLRPGAARGGTKRLADDGPWRMPRCAITRSPSRSGRIAASSSSSAQRRRSAPRARPCAARAVGLALVPGGAVAPGQLDQLVEQVPASWTKRRTAASVHPIR